MHKLVPVLGLLTYGAALADTIVLKTGDSLKGDFFGATSQQIRFVVDGKMMVIQATEIELIRFGDGPAPADPPAAEKPAPKPAEEKPPPEPAAEPSEPESSAGLPPPTPEPVETSRPEVARADPLSPGHVRAGTALFVKLLEPVDMTQDGIGSTYRGVLEKPIRSGENAEKGPVIVPAGAEVQLRLADKSQIESSNTTGTGLEATGLVYQGRPINIRTGKGFRKGRTTKEKATEGIVRTASTLGRALGGMAGRTASTRTEETIEETWDSSTRISPGTALEFVLTQGFNVSESGEPDGQAPEQQDQFVAGAPPAPVIDAPQLRREARR